MSDEGLLMFALVVALVGFCMAAASLAGIGVLTIPGLLITAVSYGILARFLFRAPPKRKDAAR